MNKHHDFEQQWERRRREAQCSRCPLGDDALEAAVDHAIRTPSGSAGQVVRRAPRQLWLRPVAAAAVFAAVLAPAVVMTMRGGTADGIVRSVSVGNQQVRFVCNTGCSAEEVVSMFDSHIHRS